MKVFNLCEGGTQLNESSLQLFEDIDCYRDFNVGQRVEGGEGSDQLQMLQILRAEDSFDEDRLSRSLEVVSNLERKTTEISEKVVENEKN